MNARPRASRGVGEQLWRQVPFFVWLIALWMLLWGQFTLLAFITGLVVAVFVSTVYRLPPAELSGRVNIWHLVVFAVEFTFSLVQGSLTVAWQSLDPRRYPSTAIIAVPLRTDDDLIMTHVGVTACLIPGSLVVDADPVRRILYLHVLGVGSAADVEHQREIMWRWERRIVMALGSREQVAAVRADAWPARGGGTR